MKRFMTVLVLMLVAVSMTYAIDMSAGAGAKFTLNEWVLTSDGDSLTNSIPYINPEVFFDATYLEVALGYAVSLGGTQKDSAAGSTADLTDKYSYLTIGILGKYPVAVGGMKIFPLVGFEYDLNLTYTDEDGNDYKDGMTDEQKADLNYMWINAGVGADIAISDALFIRPQVLGGIGFLNNFDNDVLDLAEALGVDASILKFKIDLGVYIGYKF